MRVSKERRGDQLKKKIHTRTEVLGDRHELVGTEEEERDQADDANLGPTEAK